MPLPLVNAKIETSYERAMEGSWTYPPQGFPTIVGSVHTVVDDAQGVPQSRGFKRMVTLTYDPNDSRYVQLFGLMATLIVEKMNQTA